jgi:MFS family permease
LLTATGFSLLLLTAAANTLLQTLADEDKRGRVVSLYTMAVTGLAPVGGLLAGLLADQVGPAVTLRLAGLSCLAGSVAFGARFRQSGALHDLQALPVRGPQPGPVRRVAVSSSVA